MTLYRFAHRLVRAILRYGWGMSVHGADHVPGIVDEPIKGRGRRSGRCAPPGSWDAEYWQSIPSLEPLRRRSTASCSLERGGIDYGDI